jgi:hypothetical protein
LNNRPLNFGAFLNHKLTVDWKSVIPHYAYINCGRRLHLFYDESVVG